MIRSMLRVLGFSLLAGWLLSGCASGGYLLDNVVQSFSGFPAAPAQLTYRFDRLPSQQVAAQTQLEGMADPALHEAGFRRDDANPRYTVQVSAGIQRILSPWSNRWRWGAWDGHLRHRFGFGGFGYGYGGGLAGWHEPFWYHRNVSVIVRELPGNKVVYESHASNDGPWVEDLAVLSAMFKAALQGFPTPPPGPRRVDVRVGG